MKETKNSYRVLINREYYSLTNDNNKINIGLLMMVKNEHKRIKVSLDSVVGYVDCFIIYDTGSEDDTVEIIKNHCEEHKINLYLIQGEFDNFANSRNVSLQFADTIDVDYLLLLDCNDVLRGGEHLREYAKEYKNCPATGFLVAQEWWSGRYDKYYNLRFVKAREGWRYRGSVHEWMKDTKSKEGEELTPLRVPDKVVLYQDRTQDDDKSGKRFFRDKVLLLEDHKNNPTETRTLFYLAQTCSCLNQVEDAFYYYKIRSSLEGFQEEKFQAIYRCGEISETLRHPWYESMGWYMRAFEHSSRVEPLIKIANHYKENKQWMIAFTFINLACTLTYPEHCILFVDQHAYNYMRWHILGIVGYYIGKYEEGKVGCLKAIEAGLNCELDNNNLKFYLDKENEIKNNNLNNLTKKQFIELEIQRLGEENPKMSQKMLTMKANMFWKLRNKS